MTESFLEIRLEETAASAMESICRREELPLEAAAAAAAWALFTSRFSGGDAGEMRLGEFLKTFRNPEAVECDPSGRHLRIGLPEGAAPFREDVIAGIPRYLDRLLREMAAHPEAPVSSLEMLPEDERERLLSGWNRTAAEYPADCIHEQFEKQAHWTPDTPAVTFQNRGLSYRQLDEQSNQLARYLMQLGVGPETLVALSMERSLDLMVGLMAILKAGGAYVPLDPIYPVRRMEMVLADARPLVVLTQQKLAERFSGPASVVAVDRDRAEIARESSDRLGWHATPENLAYVIYTSGSTGNPKGVMIEHRNVVNFFTAMDRVIGSAEPGVWLAVTSISFDISVLELLWTLARGFHVVLQGDAVERGTEYAIEGQIRRHGVTHLQCTPSLVRMLAGDREPLQALRELKMLLLGGEALPAVLAAEIRSAISAQFFNMYGPTETTIWSTTHPVKEIGGRVPIGRPIANTQTYILDRFGRPMPVGAAGELYIGGAGVARGYLNRPELTAERFLPDPFLGNGRMYRTGDLVRYLPDGAIEYLERMDFQVKIRGFRIELGEIEAVMERYPGVRQAVAAVREEKPGDKRLIAYVVLEPGAPPGTEGLRAHLREQLPEYMVPAAFVRLEAMPLTDNGKVDRKALPPPEGREMPLKSMYEAPRKGLEQTIAEVWCEALDVERVSIHDNFFDLGAHSLLVAEVHVKLKEVLGMEIPLVAMFRYSTVSLLAEHLSREGEEAPRLTRSADRARARQESLQRRGARHGAEGV